MRPVQERRFRLRILETTAKSPSRQLARNISPVLDGIISWSAGAPISWYVFANSDQLICLALISWYVLARSDQLICPRPAHRSADMHKLTHSLISWHVDTADGQQHAFWSALCPRELPGQLICALIISWSIHADYLISWSCTPFWSADQSYNPCSLCSAYHHVNSWSPSVLIHAFCSADSPLNISNQLSTYTLCSADMYFLTAFPSSWYTLVSFPVSLHPQAHFMVSRSMRWLQFSDIFIEIIHRSQFLK